MFPLFHKVSGYSCLYFFSASVEPFRVCSLCQRFSFTMSHFEGDLGESGEDRPLILLGSTEISMSLFRKKSNMFDSEWEEFPILKYEKVLPVLSGEPLKEKAGLLPWKWVPWGAITLLSVVIRLQGIRANYLRRMKIPITGVHA